MENINMNKRGKEINGDLNCLQIMKLVAFVDHTKDSRNFETIERKCFYIN
jgi:hypothetical protein